MDQARFNATPRSASGKVLVLIIFLEGSQGAASSFRSSFLHSTGTIRRRDQTMAVVTDAHALFMSASPLAFIVGQRLSSYLTFLVPSRVVYE